eukprot:EG_transcript_17469
MDDAEGVSPGRPEEAEAGPAFLPPSPVAASCTSADRKRQSPSMAEVHLAEEPKCLTLPRIKMNSRQAEQAMVKRLLQPNHSLLARKTMEEIAALAQSNDHMPRARSKLSYEDINQVVDRLYDRGMRQIQEAREKAAAKVYPDVAPGHASAEEIEDCLDRIYSVDIEKRKGLKAGLIQKYYACSTEPLVLEPGELEESLGRVYTAAMERHQNEVAKLEEKYTFKPKRSKRLSSDEVRTVSERLCGVKKRPVQCNYTF